MKIKKVIIFISSLIFLVIAGYFLNSTLDSDLSLNQELRAVDLGKELQLPKGAQLDPKEIIVKVNEERKRLGLDPLKENEKLKKSAEIKARQLIKDEYFQHISPEGKTLASLLDEIGYDYRVATENLGQGFYSIEAMVESWMRSDEHSKNILDEEVLETGVAIEEGLSAKNQNKIVFVQHFGVQIEPRIGGEIKSCKLDSWEDCKKIKNNNQEIEKEIIKIEKIISKAKNQGAKEEYLKDLNDYLIDLLSKDDHQKVKLFECKEFIDSCNEWK